MVAINCGLRLVRSSGELSSLAMLTTIPLLGSQSLFQLRAIPSSPIMLLIRTTLILALHRFRVEILNFTTKTTGEHILHG